MTQSPNAAPDARLIESAIEYAYPVYEMARTRYMMIHEPKNPARREVNVFFHQRALVTHRARTVTTPNHDTLYSSAWLDLAASPVHLVIPPIAGRYWSVALMDAFTNNFAMLGSRLGDGVAQPTDVILIGPDQDEQELAALYQAFHGQPMPDGQRILRAPGHDVWALARWLVVSAEDAGAAHAIQDALRGVALRRDASTFVQQVQAQASPTPALFLAAVNELLARNPAPADEVALLQAWSCTGLGCGPQAWEQLPMQAQALWQERLPSLQSRFKTGFMSERRMRDGWSLPDARVGNFGRDYALRAAVALGGLAALEPAEAVYMTAATDVTGMPLIGAHRYRVRIPAEGLEAQAFWSLSMYERLPDGRMFFIDNPLHRYALGDRSPGIPRNPDGSWDLLLQHVHPEDAADMPAWLPAPAGEFRVVLRAYVPSQAMIEGHAALPRIERLD